MNLVDEQHAYAHARRTPRYGAPPSQGGYPPPDSGYGRPSPYGDVERQHLSQPQTRAAMRGHRPQRPHQHWHQPTNKLPVVALWLMAATGLITFMTEMLPVAMMDTMVKDTGMSDGTIATLVSVFAAACALAAIPMTVVTRAVPRKPLLLGLLLLFLVSNAVTALTANFWVMAPARAVAGVAAGALWAMLAGYATRTVTPDVQGKAMALAMAGTPIAMAFGLPIGTFLGDTVGWRMAFIVLSVMAAGMLVIGIKALPNVPGDTSKGRRRRGPMHVLRLDNYMTIVYVTVLFAVGHNLVYAVIQPFSKRLPAAPDKTTLMLVFGAGAAAGLWLVGKYVDRMRRELTVAVALGLTISLIMMHNVSSVPGMSNWYFGILAFWGFAFGGAPTLFQTASAIRSAPAQDIGQAIIVMAWNGAVMLASAVGGYFVDRQQFDRLTTLALAMAGLSLWLVHRAIGPWGEEIEDE